MNYPSWVVWVIQGEGPKKVQFWEESEWFVWVEFPIIDFESRGRPASGAHVQMSTIILYSLSNIVPLEV